eukprot:TRINITY_DN10080_c0_g1_i4.p1 TRINITY_DN10080_c0_g1~~TRINITY_DN10080_c0_g1_i4.p1  ORF type:complete len:175 (-),score=17.54 TRINITY_DN10080_c0_g1_i4:32-556(-)
MVCIFWSNFLTCAGSSVCKKMLPPPNSRVSTRCGVALHIVLSENDNRLIQRVADGIQLKLFVIEPLLVQYSDCGELPKFWPKRIIPSILSLKIVYRLSSDVLTVIYSYLTIPIYNWQSRVEIDSLSAPLFNEPYQCSVILIAKQLKSNSHYMVEATSFSSQFSTAWHFCTGVLS